MKELGVRGFVYQLHSPGQGNVVWFPAGARDCSLFQSAQVSSGAHPALF
jgi:hypothetical protein